MGVWKVGIFGPPETVYQGGYFKTELRFPADYPLSPPTLRFLSPIPWHPNIYSASPIYLFPPTPSNPSNPTHPPFSRVRCASPSCTSRATTT